MRVYSAICYMYAEDINTKLIKNTIVRKKDEATVACSIITTDSRYLDFAYVESPLISK